MSARVSMSSPLASPARLMCRCADHHAELGGERAVGLVGSTALAIPKSMIVGIGFPSVTRTRMLLGLRSRWITPFWCACWTPLQTATKSSRRWKISRLWRSQ